jgi:hypothetical protein
MGSLHSIGVCAWVDRWSIDSLHDGWTICISIYTAAIDRSINCAAIMGWRSDVYRRDGLTQRFTRMQYWNVNSHRRDAWAHWIALPILLRLDHTLILTYSDRLPHGLAPLRLVDTWVDWHMDWHRCDWLTRGLIATWIGTAAIGWHVGWLTHGLVDTWIGWHMDWLTHG